MALTRHCMKTQPTNSPLYDVVLASRKHAGGAISSMKANPVPKFAPPASLFDMLG